MYRILCDGYLLYDPRDDNYEILEGNLILSANTAGSLKFKIDPDNPMYGNVHLMKSIVELYDDDQLVFRGRPYSPSINLYRHDQIECEGELAFFNDTYQEPFEYYGTVSELFSRTIAFHNSQVSSEKQFAIGVCNVVNDTDSGNITRSSESYITTWDFIEDKFINSSLGGYLWVSNNNGTRTINYLRDLNFESANPQSVDQSINLIDADKDISIDGLATVVVPIGAKLENEDGSQSEERLTIASINDGKVYIESQEGINIYGRIVKIVTHDDINEVENLYTAGMRDLQDSLGVTTSIQLTAADLSKAGFSVSPLQYGTYVVVNIGNLGVTNQRMLIKKVNINLLDPASSNIEIGDEIRSLTAERLYSNRVIQNTQLQLYNNTVYNLEKKLTSLQRVLERRIDTTDGFLSEVRDTVFEDDGQGGTINVIERQQSQIDQNADSITFNFDEYKKFENTTNANYENTLNQFSEIHTYIHFSQNGIDLGASDSPYTLQINQNGIVFRYNGHDVSWWSTNDDIVKQLPSDSTFAAYAGKFVEYLDLGKFRFDVRDNGNLSITRYRKSIKIKDKNGNTVVV